MMWPFKKKRSIFVAFVCKHPKNKVNYYGFRIMSIDYDFKSANGGNRLLEYLGEQVLLNGDHSLDHEDVMITALNYLD
jgi:hypothetical protein